MTRKEILDMFYNTVSQYNIECLESDNIQSYEALLESYGMSITDDYCLLEMDFKRFFSKVYNAFKQLLKTIAGWGASIIRFFMRHFKVIFTLVTTLGLSSYILIKFGASLLKEARGVKTLKDLYDNEKMHIAVKDVFNNAKSLYDIDKEKSNDMKTVRYLNLNKLKRVFDTSYSKILNKVKSIFKIVYDSFIVVIKRIYKSKKDIIEDIKDDDTKRKEVVNALAMGSKYGKKMVLTIAKYTNKIAEYLGDSVFGKFGNEVKSQFSDYIKEHNEYRIENYDNMNFPDDKTVDKLELTLEEKFSYRGVNKLFEYYKSYYVNLAKNIFN